MDEVLMVDWVHTVWDWCPGALLRCPNMLLLAEFWGHSTVPVETDTLRREDGPRRHSQRHDVDVAAAGHRAQQATQGSCACTVQ